MTYQGYALPRLEALSGRAWLAIIIVSFGWALQHSALPLMWDWRWALYRFGSSLLIGIVIPIIYLAHQASITLYCCPLGCKFRCCPDDGRSADADTLT